MNNILDQCSRTSLALWNVSNGIFLSLQCISPYGKILDSKYIKRHLLLSCLCGAIPQSATSEVLEFNKNGVRIVRLQVTSNVLEVAFNQRPVYKEAKAVRHEAVVSTEINKTTHQQGSTAVILPAESVARLIEITALKYAKHKGIRKAGLTVVDWKALFQANIQIESAYKTNARSHVGAIGLGQLMPKTAKRLGVNPHVPSENLDGSARYLLKQLDAFASAKLALAAYNAGPQAVTKYGGIPPYKETQDHVRKVMSVFRKLGGNRS